LVLLLAVSVCVPPPLLPARALFVVCIECHGHSIKVGGHQFWLGAAMMPCHKRGRARGPTKGVDGSSVNASSRHDWRIGPSRQSSHNNPNKAPTGPRPKKGGNVITNLDRFLDSFDRSIDPWSVLAASKPQSGRALEPLAVRTCGSIEEGGRG
jgi:hypothetical protein